MSRRQGLIAALLALAVLLGQWAAVVHQGDHVAGTADCTMCAYAHGLGSGVLPALPAVAINAGTEAPLTPVAARVAVAARRHHPIRGPPAVLA